MKVFRRARHPWRAARYPPQPNRRVKDAAPYENHVNMTIYKLSPKA